MDSFLNSWGLTLLIFLPFVGAIVNKYAGYSVI